MPQGAPVRPRDDSFEELDRFCRDAENFGMVDKYMDILCKHPKYKKGKAIELEKDETGTYSKPRTKRKTKKVTSED